MADTSIMNLSTIAEAITCPITQDIMTDPVTGKDGHTYERSAIVHALTIKAESPMTREHMTIQDLKVNPSIKFLCEKYNSMDPNSQERQQVQAAAANLTREQSTNNSINSKIVLNSTLTKNSNSNHFHIKFKIDESTMPSGLEFGHLSQDVILVIDRSGSMNAAVEAKDKDGNNLESGMSIQDIVNHAAKTVAKTLDKKSRLAVIAFDTEIITIMELTLMTEMNQNNALSLIDTIKPRYQTNIWGGIQTAIEILEKREDKSRNSAILMLTDGQPNVSPARGELETLKILRYKKNLYIPLYNFGFGYYLQRNLLYDMSKFGGGGNGHIPDGSMIATVFCNFISTILCTVFMDIQLYVNSDNLEIMGDFAKRFDTEKEMFIYDIGTIQIGQDKDIIMLAKDPEIPFEYYYTYVIGNIRHTSQTFKYDPNISNVCGFETNAMIPHIDRYLLVQSIRKIISNCTSDLFYQSEIVFKEIENILNQHKHLGHLSEGMLTNLVGDGTNSGQIKLAMDKKYIKRWGELYLDQLSRSLNQQIKPNFKDSACPFGGDVFTDIVDKASDIFDTLPPPKPSLINNLTSNLYGGPSYRSTGTPTPQISMSTFNNALGGCFMSDTQVLMSDNSLKSIISLRPGDEVWSLTNPYNSDGQIQTAKVLALVQINCTSKSKNISYIGNLRVTPWHPIIYNKEWVHPNSVSQGITPTPCDAVYNVILSNSHTINVSGYWAITLGHDYKVGILAHNYFGSQKIIEDLMHKPGWNDGHVIINDNQFVRHHIDGEIVGLTRDLNTDIDNRSLGYNLFG